MANRLHESTERWLANHSPPPNFGSTHQAGRSRLSWLASRSSATSIDEGGLHHRPELIAQCDAVGIAPRPAPLVVDWPAIRRPLGLLAHG
ncbi:MAG: hypothetical protein EBY28_02135 [Betaproteobacteria bacterium]|nr:hypothetical protein [Betaproteobacteria bacterium]